MGLVIQYIKRCPQLRQYVKGENFLIDNLGFLKSYIEKLDINGGISFEVSNWIKTLEKYKEKVQIDSRDATLLNESAGNWLSMINRTLVERKVIELIKTGALNQKALLDTASGEPSAFFDEKIWNALSTIEKNDFSDAARCLLSAISTPAAMIALRGAEATVKKYCEFKTCNSAEKKMWKPIVDELKKRAVEFKIKDSFLGYLDYIRDAKRNFAAHPNKVFNQREAELIFMQVINLVQDTYEEIL